MNKYKINKYQNYKTINKFWNNPIIYNKFKIIMQLHQYFHNFFINNCMRLKYKYIHHFTI